MPTWSLKPQRADQTNTEQCADSHDFAWCEIPPSLKTNVFQCWTPWIDLLCVYRQCRLWRRPGRREERRRCTGDPLVPPVLPPGESQTKPEPTISMPLKSSPKEGQSIPRADKNVKTERKKKEKKSISTQLTLKTEKKFFSWSWDCPMTLKNGSGSSKLMYAVNTCNCKHWHIHISLCEWIEQGYLQHLKQW